MVLQEVPTIEVVVNNRAKQKKRHRLDRCSFAQELKRTDAVLLLKGSNRLGEKMKFNIRLCNFLTNGECKRTKIHGI